MCSGLDDAFAGIRGLLGGLRIAAMTPTPMTSSGPVMEIARALQERARQITLLQYAQAEMRDVLSVCSAAGVAAEQAHDADVAEFARLFRSRPPAGGGDLRWKVPKRRGRRSRSQTLESPGGTFETPTPPRPTPPPAAAPRPPPPAAAPRPPPPAAAPRPPPVGCAVRVVDAPDALIDAGVLYLVKEWGHYAVRLHVSGRDGHLILHSGIGRVEARARAGLRTRECRAAPGCCPRMQICPFYHDPATHGSTNVRDFVDPSGAGPWTVTAAAAKMMRSPAARRAARDRVSHDLIFLMLVENAIDRRCVAP